MMRAVMSVGAVLGAAASTVSGGACEWDWIRLGDIGAGPDNEIRTVQLFDDGTGEAVYAGGFFSTAGGQTVNGIARWDGTDWSALVSPGGIGVGLNRVYAMEVFDDGSGPALFVGGDFVTAGGVTVNGIAKWDGSGWTALTGPNGTGVDLQVNTLQVFNDGTGNALYVGGRFFEAGGEPINHIARWDGNNWSAVGGPNDGNLNGEVRALAVYNDGGGPALYAAGVFTTIGLDVVNRIARWDGTSWTELTQPGGTGVDGEIRALEVFNDGTGSRLYAGGFFNLAGGQTANSVASWDGTLWSGLSGSGGIGVSGGGVASLAVYDEGSGTNLYVGGNFQNAGNVEANGIARWDGSNWSALTGSLGTGVSNFVNVMLPFDDDQLRALLVAGSFNTAGEVAVDNIALWGCEIASESCPEDVTGDGVVDLADLNLVLANFGQTTSEGDTNGDGVVDLADLNTVLAAFGETCG
ncbi:MAG: GC-type dockerin domain-anchored protein [Phycisphaerales bacterium]